MKKLFLFHILFFIPCCLFAQNVGIGTLTPQSRLEITHDGASTYGTALLLNQNALGNSDGPRIQFHKTMAFPKSWTAGMLHGVDVGSFSINEDGGTGGFGNPRLVIAQGGNIGIGTTAPGFPLNFPDSHGDKISFYGNTGNHVGIGVQHLLLQIHTDGPGTDIAFGHGRSGSLTELMRIKGTGNVGIGTIAPSEKLEVAGSIKAGEYKFSTPKTYYYSIPPTGFKGMGSVQGESIVTTTTAAFINDFPTTSNYLVAPVYLPHGATVISVTLYCGDYTSSTNIRLRLEGHIHGTGGFFVLATAETTGTPGDNSVTTNTISDPVISNLNYDYTVWVQSTNGNWPGNSLLLRSVLITYTLPAVY